MFGRCVLVSFFVFLSLSALGQNRAVSFEELTALQEQEARPVVVLISTSWCKYCHAMKNSMLKNKEVSMLLARKYRTVFLDADDKDSIIFAGRTFRHEQGVNSLAKELGKIGGQIFYPTICILNKENEIIYQQEGYLSPGALLVLFANLSPE